MQGFDKTKAAKLLLQKMQADSAARLAKLKNGLQQVDVEKKSQGFRGR